MRRVLRSALIVGTAALVVPAVVGSSASATSCAIDPSDPPLTVQQMIRTGTTGEPLYRVLFLGRVTGMRDLDGDPGGRVAVKVRVSAHPVGFAPVRSRVVELTDDPDEGTIAGRFTFQDGRRYAVVAHRTHAGSFRIAQFCGLSERVSRGKMVRLLRLFRRS